MRPKKANPKITTKSVGKEDASVSNGNSVDLPMEVPSSPSTKKRSLADIAIGMAEKTEEPNSKKSKNETNTQSKEEPTTPKNCKPDFPRFRSPREEPVSKSDREDWHGFCDIESDPTLFSVMLREMGVNGVAVRDIFSLDPETLAQIPKPIYSFVLIFRARQVNSENQEEECPDKIWFANQLPGQNSCATMAMINTLMNYSHVVDLGEHLRQFKDFTANMTPYQRGQALASFDFVRHIHNSFAKNMDILENDKQLAAKVKKAEYRKASGIKTKFSRASSEDSNSSNISFEDAAHHFIAFVPIDNEIWKLDGMDCQPTLMGKYNTDATDDWVTVASQHINTIMAAGDNDYGVIALCKAPVASLRRKMCNTVTTFKKAITRIATMNADWASFLPAPEEGAEPAEPVTVPMLNSLGITDDMLAAAAAAAEVSEQIEAETFPQLLERCSHLCSEQIRTREHIFLEMSNEEEENQKARERRMDLGPVIKKWLEMLAENGWLEQNLDRFMPEKNGKLGRVGS